MRAAFLTAPQTFEIREIPEPEKKEGEVLVRIAAAGVCGSDLHFYSQGRIGEVVLTDPFVMGHECSGIVEDAGEGSAFPLPVPQGSPFRVPDVLDAVEVDTFGVVVKKVDVP